MIMNNLVLLYIILPMAVGFLIPVTQRSWKGFYRVMPTLILLFLTCQSVYLLIVTHPNAIIYKVGNWDFINMVPIGIFLVVDSFSAFMLLIINMIGFLAVFYAIPYIKRYTAEGNFYTLFCMMITGMNGVVIAGDIFNLYVFLEIAVIASYALVAFGTEKEEMEASFKYQVLGGIASMLIVLGLGILYWYTKTLNIADISSVIAKDGSKPALIFIQIIFITGFSLKAAMIPFHAWLPDAHSSAPSPISAMLSGVLIKAVGIYVIIRLFFNMFSISHEIALVITILGTLSMVLGGLLAIGQQDIKRLLALLQHQPDGLCNCRRWDGDDYSFNQWQ